MKRDRLKNLLSAIDRLVSATQIIFSRASLDKKLSQLDALGEIDNRYFSHSLKRFEQNNLIKTFKEKRQIYYHLAEKGLAKLTSYRLKRKTAVKNQNWDGCWRLVIFDIPESKKIA